MNMPGNMNDMNDMADYLKQPMPKLIFFLFVDAGFRRRKRHASPA